MLPHDPGELLRKLASVVLRGAAPRRSLVFDVEVARAEHGVRVTGAVAALAQAAGRPGPAPASAAVSQQLSLHAIQDLGVL